MSTLKQLIKRALPAAVVRPYEAARQARRFAGRSTGEVFEQIYAQRMWGAGREAAQRFYSGQGSHDPVVVEPYVAALTAWLAAFPCKPDVVDLGCGDFNVGARLRPHCGRYVACDVVEPLVCHNARVFEALEVDFHRVDAARDPLPDAQVYFVRQVFQHLANTEIQAALAKITAACRYLVVTEHLPPNGDFVANRDKPNGPGIRSASRSGVVLTEPPFALEAEDAVTLCEVAAYDGVIRTIAYRFAAV
jgi:hypothetical protein